MRQRAIANELQPWSRRKFATSKENFETRLDYLYSEDLEEIEDGIKETARGIDTASLAIALAIAKIDQLALYIQVGYKSYLEYIKAADTRLNMPAQTVSDYKRIGETYIQYRERLQKAGFQEEGNLHKLRYLELALKHHNPREVFRRLTSDSFRRFKEFATNGGPSERSDEEADYEPEVRVTPTQIKIDGKNVLKLDKNLDERVRNELAEYLKSIYTIKASGNTALVIDVYDTREIRAIHNFLRQFRSKK
jgi:hypothetical protein